MSTEGVPPPPAPPVPPPPAPSGQRNMGMLVLCYLGLLALIPLLVEKNDKEVQWHAKHGLVITGLFFVIWFAISALGYMIPFFYLLHPLSWFAWLAITILCIMKATSGQRFLIPGVSEFADKF